MAIVTASYTVEWRPSVVWENITTSVISVPDGLSEMTAGGDQPLAFGDSAESSCSIEVIDTLTAGDDMTGTPIRVTFSINGTAVEAFVGIITEQSESTTEATVTFSCSGAAETIRTTKAYSPAFYLRPVATKTSPTSAEDITLTATMGIMNYGLWAAGGRPYEQAVSYPGAAFYYSLDQAMLAPTWSWLAGEDGWAEMQKLAQAAGGQLYQDTQGVIRYKQPLNIVANAPTYDFNSGTYGGATRSRKRGQLATKVIVTYVPREARPLQEVVDDATPRLLHDNESVQFTLEPQWPLKSLEVSTGATNIADMDGNEQLPVSAVTITDLTGEPIPQGGSGYGHQIDVAAQRIAVTLTNTSNRPIVLWRIVLRGEPITAGEGGIVTQGTGDVERQVADNPYIQSAGHATRLANLILTFYSEARAAVEVEGCVYDPARTVGEIVTFTATRWNVSGVPHVIVKAAHDQTGAGASYTLAPVAGLPAATDYFQVGNVSYAGLTRVVAF